MFKKILAYAKAVAVLSVMDQSVTQVAHIGIRCIVSVSNEGFTSSITTAAHTATNYRPRPSVAASGKEIIVLHPGRGPPATTRDSLPS